MYDTLIKHISDTILHDGYANQQATGYLSGHEIVKYFVERSEKYKLGLSPSGNPLLSYLIPRIVFDGIAYQQYMGRNTQGGNYYFFRRNYASTLDFLYLYMMSENQELGEVDLFIVSSLFHKIESIVNEELEHDFHLEKNCGYMEDNELKYLFERLHFLGRCIYVSWINHNSPRFRLIKNLIDEKMYPSGT